jgi:hypothetical protein
VLGLRHRVEDLELSHGQGSAARESTAVLGSEKSITGPEKVVPEQPSGPPPVASGRADDQIGTKVPCSWRLNDFLSSEAAKRRRSGPRELTGRDGCATCERPSQSDCEGLSDV